MRKWLEGYYRFLEALLVLMLSVMVVLVFGNVVLRYAFSSGITMSEEVSRWLFVWLTALGAVVALGRHAHLGTDVLTSRLGTTARRACAIVGHLLMLYVTWLLLSGTWTQTLINADVSAPVTGAPVAIVYVAGVVFSASAIGLLLINLVAVLRNRGGDLSLVRSEAEGLEQFESGSSDRQKQKSEVGEPR